ncbi:MerR family transcriptional regulator [Prescottella defluvii]|uniref:MerR family transcriptional regulator/heat shock protein HspR n=2 Tax=Prescottella agglutinans TaxID=1644129 RepID=A0ABT6M826_9NOCA|nr:MerR family transcriptional regulator/heat shock protein HspR [Prescottella agglutinans]WFR73498.1 MerR family transcriptional regulator [Prescottella defluvii]
MTQQSPPRSTRGVYGISVTSELTGIGPQTLRLYERRGLIMPSRTGGGTRRYSEEDLYRLSRVSELVEAGVNLTGIRQILELEAAKSELEAENARLRQELAARES